ncbi:hypothetical protein GF327_04760 [Candidatus Woesearchaeota archaeon]|nr:hypothetical protein [Candidatus Woesearchaeota archaeon]
MDKQRLCEIQAAQIKNKIEYYSFQLNLFWKITLLVVLGIGAVFLFVKTVVAFAKFLFYAVLLFAIIYLIMSVFVMNSYSVKIKKYQAKLNKIYDDHILSARMK